MINNKSYIGITSRTVDDRFQEHLSRSRCAQRFNRLYQAIRKYGKDNFVVEELATTDSDNHVRALETKFINEFDSYANGYNCNLGGNGNLIIPPETRIKIGMPQKGKIIPLETREKMSLAKRGDKRCADNFKSYIGKGGDSPLSKSYLIQFPDGHIEVIRGFRKFCRDNNLTQCKLNAGRTKGFILLERLNDYPEREYTQVGGSARLP